MDGIEYLLPWRAHGVFGNNAFALIALDNGTVGDVALVESSQDVCVVLAVREMVIFKMMIVVEKQRDVDVLAIFAL